MVGELISCALLTACYLRYVLVYPSRPTSALGRCISRSGIIVCRALSAAISSHETIVLRPRYGVLGAARTVDFVELDNTVHLSCQTLNVGIRLRADIIWWSCRRLGGAGVLRAVLCSTRCRDHRYLDFVD